MIVDRLASGAILMYHAVLPGSRTDAVEDPNGIVVSTRRFAEQMETLDRLGLRGVSVAELVTARERAEERGLVGISFDDGYAGLLETAGPVLCGLGFSATTFVVAGRLGGVNEWDEAPRLRLADADEVRAMAAAGWEIGSHSLSHRDLSGDDSWVAREIRESRSVLEELAGSVLGFCYPYGRDGECAAGCVRDAGYEYACAHKPGPRVGRYALPRVYVGEREGGVRLTSKLLLQTRVWEP